MINWKLKQLLADAGVNSSRQLHKRLIQELGIDISSQSLSKLINKTPSAIKLETMQIICNLLNCKLSDILLVEPDTLICPNNKTVKPYKANNKLMEKICFTDPRELLK